MKSTKTGALERCEKRCSLKFRKFHRKTPVPESFFDKVTALAQVFSREFCEISKNNFLIEHLITKSYSISEADSQLKITARCYLSTPPISRTGP